MDLSSALKRAREEETTVSSTETVSQEDNDDVGLRPVCLPTPRLSYTNYSGVVTGWGTTEEGGSVANTLQEVSRLEKGRKTETEDEKGCLHLVMDDDDFRFII